LDSIIYVISGLLVISLLGNLVLYAKVKTLSRQLAEVDERVELTKEELSQIRLRLEKMKKEI